MYFVLTVPLSSLSLHFERLVHGHMLLDGTVLERWLDFPLAYQWGRGAPSGVFDATCSGVLTRVRMLAGKQGSGAGRGETLPSAFS